MSARGVLARGRARHLLILLDTCKVTRVTGQTLNTATDTYTDTFSTIYTGPCRIKAFRTGRPKEAGQVAIMDRVYDVQVPWDATGPVLRGDTITVTASDDAWVIGRPLIAIEINYSGTQTVRHIMVEDLS